MLSDQISNFTKFRGRQLTIIQNSQDSAKKGCCSEVILGEIQGFFESEAGAAVSEKGAEQVENMC